MLRGMGGWGERGRGERRGEIGRRCGLGESGATAMADGLVFLGRLRKLNLRCAVRVRLLCLCQLPPLLRLPLSL